ncbi:S9 family peptidase [Amycolatopsis panacis]|nr:S9 family peptidase [Amycolatopsis panacis]
MAHPEPGAPAGPLTPADLAALRSLSDPQVSPDGRLRACVVQEPAPEHGEPERSAIWLARGDEPAAPVTSGAGADQTPRISPSGRFLAFTSDREQPGLWRLYIAPLDADGTNEPWKIDGVPGVVEDIVWAADESGLVVLTADEGSDSGNIRGATRFVPPEEAGASFLVRRPATVRRRVHWVRLPSGTVRQVSQDDRTVWEIGWAGQGPLAAVVSADPTESGWYDAELATIDLADATTKIVYTPSWQLQSPAVSPDGRSIAFLEAPQSDRALLAGSLTILDLDTGSVTRPEHEADLTRVRWTADGRLFWLGVASVETACGFFRPGETGWQLDQRWRGLGTLGRTYLTAATCSLDGTTIVAGFQAHNEPPELRQLDQRPGEAPHWRALTSLNTALAGRARVRESVHKWKSFDGIEIEGILLLPENGYETPLPLVVVPHGGPTNATTSVFAAGAHRGDGILLAQAGCAVLLPNPRGSTGRGREFMAANLGDMGGGDLRDLEAGVDSLAAAGIADPARTGIVGISYGGFMSAWAAACSDRFAASIPISGISDWLSFHHTSNLGRFDEIYLDGSPYDPAGPYLDRSPVFHAAKCRTPTLLLHGDADLACPVTQAQEFYQALAAVGCETEFVIYKGAGHGMTEREHVLDVSERILGWFSRHLGFPVPGGTP